MDIRNIAIIAHVDHGKTTLVDGMLKQTHTFRENQAEMGQTTILDSNELEREKGITILAKNTSVVFHDTKINIIDTPGHADFSGEVERIINMADGALLIVDAAEGPLPQTQFVLTKALERDLPVIVVVNKIDRKDARPDVVLREVEELFLQLATKEEHLKFTTLYAIGRDGKSWRQLPADPAEPGDLTSLFETIVSFVPPPPTEADKPFKMLVSTLDFDDYKGTFAIGKVSRGTVKPGQSIFLMRENEKIGQFRIDQVFTSQGLKRVETAQSQPGDIIAVTGIPDVSIGFTITDPSDPTGYPAITIEEPTLKILLSANTSPFSGREGKFCTARQIHQRLMKEMKTNIGLRITENPDGSGFVVAGRGELHLAILLETLRREDYEMQVSKPEVILKTIDGVLCEPFEEITVEIAHTMVGIIAEELGRRKGELIDTKTDERNITRMVYRISTRNLLGFRGEIMTKTRGNGIFATSVVGYSPAGKELAQLRNGVLVAFETGKSTAYALENVQNRGKAFIGPGEQIYQGQIIGLNSRMEDIDINATKSKNLTNMHAANSNIAVQLDPPVRLTLEQCLDFIQDDELLEITPKNLRLRKKLLTPVDRTRAARVVKNQG